MRYDTLLLKLQRAREAYEHTVRQLIHDAVKADESATEAIHKIVKTVKTVKTARGPYKKKRKLSAKARASVIANLAKARAAKKAKAAE